MGTVIDAFTAAFRRYNTDGSPSSGPKKPAKTDAQGLGATIESFVAAAIAAVTGYVTTGLASKADKARAITGSGYLSGQGGDLSADRVFSLPKGTGSDAIAGTDDTRPIHSAALAARIAAGFSVANLTFLKHGKNLIRPSAAVPGYYVDGTNGNHVSSASYCIAVVPVSPGDVLTISEQRQYAWFGNSGYISGVGTQTALPATITAPAGATRLEASVVATKLNVSVQIEAGSSSTAFEKYSYQPDQSVDQPFAVSTAALLDGAVTPEKTSFFAVGKNLINPATVTTGYYVDGATGALASNVNYCAAFVAVTAGDVLTISDQRQYAWFNAAGAFISGNAGATGAAATITAPAGAVRLGMSVLLTGLNTTVQLEFGSLATAFETFRYVVKPGNLAGIADNSIVPGKTTFFETSFNLFDLAAATTGYYINSTNGVLTSNAAYYASAFIPVTAGSTYWWSLVKQGAWYTAARAYISGIADQGTVPNFVTAPANAAYVRISVPTSRPRTVFKAGGPKAFEAAGPYIAASVTHAREVPPAYCMSALREFRQRLTKHDCGGNAVIRHLSCADSYGHRPERWVGKFYDRMRTRWDPTLATGDVGGGWVGFGDLSANLGTYNNGNLRSTYGYSRSGTWTTDSLYYTGGGPDLGAIQSSSVGARVILTFPASPVHTAAKLFWRATADGVVRYSYDAGSTWTSINVQGTVGDFGVTNLLTGLPSGAGTLWIEVVSGTVKLTGLDWRSAAYGYSLLKAGATGSTLAQWATASATAPWRAAVTEIDPCTISLMIGTNDNNATTDKATFKGYLQTFLDNARLAVPRADLWLIAPAQTPRISGIFMTDYAEAMYEMALDYSTNRVAFTSMQDGTGDPFNPTFYSSQGSRAWYNDDGGDGLAATDIHPSDNEGGVAIAGMLERAALYYP